MQWVRLTEVSPVSIGEITMWKDWVGCNGSHCFGASLFGVVCAPLVLAFCGLLFDSSFQLSVGLALRRGHAFLRWRYCVRLLFRGTDLWVYFRVFKRCTTGPR